VTSAIFAACFLRALCEIFQRPLWLKAIHHPPIDDMH